MNKKAIIIILIAVFILCVSTPLICMGSAILRFSLYNNEYRHAKSTDNLGINGYIIGISKDRVNNKTTHSLYIEGNGDRFTLFTSDWFLINEEFEYQVFEVNGVKYLIYVENSGGSAGNLGFAIYRLDLPEKVELMRIPAMSEGKNEFILECTHPLIKGAKLSYLGSQGDCDFILFDPKALFLEFDINQAKVSTTIYPDNKSR